jgi:hypothetical protein
MPVECNQRALQSARWFDAAIVAPAERVLQRRRSGHRADYGRSLAGFAERHGRRRAEWKRAARFYLDGIEQDSNDPAIWIELGRALKEAGKDVEAHGGGVRWLLGAIVGPELAVAVRCVISDRPVLRPWLTPLFQGDECDERGLFDPAHFIIAGIGRALVKILHACALETKPDRKLAAASGGAL